MSTSCLAAILFQVATPGTSGLTMVAIIVGTLIYYQNCSCTLPTAPKVPGLTLHCNIFFLLQVIDVLAASIEYGLEATVEYSNTRSDKSRTVACACANKPNANAG